MTAERIEWQPAEPVQPYDVDEVHDDDDDGQGDVGLTDRPQGGHRGQLRMATWSTVLTRA